MNVLESIRKRTGLLVGIVGLALVIFILESLLGSGSSIFSGDVNTVGVVNGKKIDRNEFYTKVENQLNGIRQQKQTNDIDDQTRKQVVEYIFQSYISEHVIKPQYNKLGLSVGEDELYENMVVNPSQVVIQRLTDPNTRQLNPQFALPDGSLDRNKWKQVVASVTGDQELAVKQMEEDVANTRLAEKYSALIKKAIYVTAAEAKSNYIAQGTKLNVSFVMKRYDSVGDSAVKVSDDDLKKYYEDNKYKYVNNKASRKIEYVSFPIAPSVDDVAAIEKNSMEIADAFKAKKASEDSAFMMAESENGQIIVQEFSRKNMVIRDTTIYTDPIGTVYGPYNEGAYFKIYKLSEINNIADSCKVRHILIGTIDPQTQKATRAKAAAKKTADSLLVLIKDKKVTFDTLVKTISDDKGSVDKGGDYGWFNETTQFVEPFKNAGLRGVKGNISVVETAFGYHIIEVVDLSATRHTNYRLEQIFKPIVPSEETTKRIFEEAKQFAGENNTGELFDKGIETKKLTKRLADNIDENDITIPGLESAKELVRWVYSANKNDVNLFSYNDKHMVVKLSSIKEKGYLPLEDVKDDVMAEAIQQKKAEMFLSEFKAKAAGSSSVEDIAKKLNLEALTQDNLTPEAHNVQGVGHDDVLVGTAAGTKQGSISKPIAGELGVFVVKVNAVMPGAPVADYKEHKKMLEQMYTYRADTEFYTALKDKANIENHTGRYE
jgi:peptidyl-prolyl cis-trans isomerase D